MRYLYVGLTLLLLASPALAATIHIDGGCPTQGDTSGSNDFSETCDGSAADNPYNGLEDVFPSAEACGNTYVIRGVHAAHGSCPGFNGRYFGNEWAWDQTCTSLTAAIIQPYGYGSSQERVYLDGTRCPHPSGCSNCDYTACEGQDAAGEAWEQCDWDGAACDCDAGNQNVVIGAGGSTACEETWFTMDCNNSECTAAGAPCACCTGAGTGTCPTGTGFQSGSAAGVLWAQKDDGSITFPVPSLAAMTNATAGYNDDRCTNAADSAQKWMPCTTNSDCLTGETCSAGASPEVDCFRSTTPNPDVLLCRWGSSLPTRPYVNYSAAGTGFTLKKQAAFVTIRGFDFRCHKISSVYSNGDEDAADAGDNTVTDNRVFFNSTTNGSDYGMTFYQVNRATVSNNEIAYTNSEGIHCNAYNSATASVINITGNYIHNQGDQSIMGTASTAGTPVGITCNPAENASSSGNFTGSFIQNNYIVDIKARPDVSSTYGVRLEHCVDGMIVRNNVLLRAGTQQAFLIDSSDQASPAGNCQNNQTTEGQEYYNNIIIDQGDECFQIFSETAGTGTWAVDNIKIYNNTCLNPGSSGGIAMGSDVGGGVTNVLVRNNIFSTGAVKAVNFTKTDASNIFDFNLVETSANPAITWLNTNRACADIDLAGAGNIENCPDPVFVNEGTDDLHLQTSSPAKNTGTTTGMPSGRTTDINNTVTDDHGLVSYADAQAASGTVDIGADEFVSAGKRRILVTVSP